MEKATKELALATIHYIAEVMIESSNAPTRDSDGYIDLTEHMGYPPIILLSVDELKALQEYYSSLGTETIKAKLQQLLQDND